MHRRFVRRAPLVGAIAALALAGAGGDALAHRHPTGHHHRGHHRLSAWDKQWLMMSIEGDRFEIAGGKLAQAKGANAVIRSLGARLVTDHSKSLADAVAVARKLHVEVPGEPSPSQQWELQVVGSFSGNDFDRWYARLEVQDHVQDIQEASDEVSDGSSRKVRKLAKSDLPVLQQHLTLAQQALQTVGG